ncbi:MAG: NACHT domain-containing protein [Anaerolineales bacterium]|nr:NACHT domain-containing protein [Anaerolineales bacterium]
MKPNSNWRTILWVIAGLLFIAGILPLVLGMITQYKENPRASFGAELLILPVIAFFIVVLLVLGQYSAKLSVFNFFEYDFSSPRHKRERQALIDYVREDWVKGVYEESLYNFARCELGLRTEPHAFDRPKTFRPAMGKSRKLSLNTNMYQVYRAANRYLLILGEPGSGKTTMLLELAQELLDKAELDDSLPIPVVLSLASWTEKYANLSEWIIDKLGSEYGINRRIGEKWIFNSHLLVLLDGLDEVQPNCRSACVQAINAYIAEYEQNGLVVCGRISEYSELLRKLDLDAEIELLPLEIEQIEHYLRAGDVDMRGLLEAIRQTPALLEMAQTPLMLNIMALAFRGQPADKIVLADERAIYANVFSQYVDQMFARNLRNDGDLFSQTDTEHYLSWLARQLVQMNLTEFDFGALHQSWLETKKQYRLFNSLYLYLAFSVVLLGIIWKASGIEIQGWDGWPVVGLLLLYYYYKRFSRHLAEDASASKKLFTWKEMGKKLLPVLLSGIFLWISTPLMLWFLYMHSGWTSYALPILVFIGIVSGLMIGAGLIFLASIFPFLDYVRLTTTHYILRYALSSDGQIPWKFNRFLDYAAERTLLRKKGGGYIFIHRMLMEYFAELDL